MPDRHPPSLAGGTALAPRPQGDSPLLPGVLPPGSLGSLIPASATQARRPASQPATCAGFPAGLAWPSYLSRGDRAAPFSWFARLPVPPHRWGVGGTNKEHASRHPQLMPARRPVKRGGPGAESPERRCVPIDGETPARPPLSAGWQSLPFAQLQVLVSLSVQSSFHLSLAVLVCYRSPTAYLALGGVYHPHSGCTLKQPDSATAARCWSTSASHPLVKSPSLRAYHPL